MPVSYMEVNLSALRHNLKVIRAHLPKEVNALAVVKANAYGHGAIETLRIALEEGYVAAAVARVEEGAELVGGQGFHLLVFDFRQGAALRRVAGYQLLLHGEIVRRADHLVDVADGLWC